MQINLSLDASFWFLLPLNQGCSGYPVNTSQAQSLIVAIWLIGTFTLTAYPAPKFLIDQTANDRAISTMCWRQGWW